MQAIAAVQEKLLQLNGATLGHLSNGRIVNLVSNDVRRFDDVGSFWVFVWAGPLETLVVLLLVALEFGVVPAVAGVSTLLLLVPLQAMLASTIAGLRTQTAGYTDERVRITGLSSLVSFETSCIGLFIRMSVIIHVQSAIIQLHR
jgi:hypothetical protein